MMQQLSGLFGVAMLFLRIWKHIQVVRFFRRRWPAPTTRPPVTVMQPILSGDPLLADCLRRNLLAEHDFPVAWLWLVDSNDQPAQRICAELVAAFPHRAVQIITLPPPPERTNPKLFKLRRGLAHAQGEVIVVLDDDTILPTSALDLALPLLDAPDAGLVFGLPYYRSFAPVWSALVALFVNTSSLPTYTSYIALTEPFTINGMFYAMRRETLRRLGDFAGIEGVLADDFAVAQQVRAAGLRLVQSPVRHPVATTVPSASRYQMLLRRWFTFPRESLLRHLRPHEQAVLIGLAVLPTLAPLLVVLAAALSRSRWQGWLVAALAGHSLIQAFHLNRAYLRNATPRRWLLLAPLLDLVTPVQVMAALLSRQRIIWRGHVMDVEKGGTFRFVARRNQEDV